MNNGKTYFGVITVRPFEKGPRTACDFCIFILSAKKHTMGTATGMPSKVGSFMVMAGKNSFVSISLRA